jgi:hypothetical protein
MRAGLFDSPAGDELVGDIYSAVVIMAIVTTLTPAILLPRLLGTRTT